jgi:hypothetical protein
VSDRDLWQAAWKELTLTTDSYPAWKKKGFPASSHWAKARTIGDQIDGSAVPPPQQPDRLATMETGDFSQFDSINSSVSQGTMAGDTSRAYRGFYSAHASTPTGSGTKYARGIFNVNWVAGSDVWYQAAFWLPTDFYSKAQGWVDILRWDNWTLAQRSQDQAGITVTQDGKLVFTKRDLNLPNNGLVYLTTSVAAPSLGVWHMLKVHQKFSQTDGAALNELYVDDVKAAASTAANYNGRQITALRVGIVATNDATQTNRVDLWFDDAGVS